jgi:hypothetical protein
MAALPTAQAAMDAHRGVAAVAEHGLAFLWNMCIAEANEVSWWACFGQPCCTLLCPRSHACMRSMLCARAWLCTGAVDGGPVHRPSDHGCPPGSGGRGGARAELLEEPVYCGGQQASEQGELVGVFRSVLVHLLVSLIACIPSAPCARALLCTGAVDGGPAHRPSGRGCPPGSGGRGGAGAGLLVESEFCERQQGELADAFGSPPCVLAGLHAQFALRSCVAVYRCR